MSSKPDDVPEDVWGTAEAIWPKLASGLVGFTNMRQVETEFIARAILAERKRCAERYRAGAGPNSWDFFIEAEQAILA